VRGRTRSIGANEQQEQEQEREHRAERGQREGERGRARELRRMVRSSSELRLKSVGRRRAKKDHLLRENKSACIRVGVSDLSRTECFT
jgi:hypothetical protein